MKTQAIIASKHAVNLAVATSSQQDPMKKSNALYQFALVAALLLLALRLHAQSQPTPFEIANEMMMFQQSAAHSYIASTLGPDPASPLTYSTYVDPAGQNFQLLTELRVDLSGKPITLTTSGRSVSHNTWTVSSSGTYNGLPHGLQARDVCAAYGLRGTLWPRCLRSTLLQQLPGKPVLPLELCRSHYSVLLYSAISADHNHMYSSAVLLAERWGVLLPRLLERYAGSRFSIYDIFNHQWR